MAVIFQNDDDIGRLVGGLLDHSLPQAQWTHAAHFAATLWLLRHASHPPLEGRLPAIIRSYNAASGAQNTDHSGYHETITQASLAAARRFLDGQPPEAPLHEIVDLLMRSPLGRSDWLMAYWSRDRLFSVEARRQWVEPDLQAF
jgi:hypothetical protein